MAQLKISPECLCYKKIEKSNWAIFEKQGINQGDSLLFFICFRITCILISWSAYAIMPVGEKKWWVHVDKKNEALRVPAPGASSYFLWQTRNSPPPVAGYRLDNTVSITYLLSFWKYKQFLEVYKIILGLFEYIILKSSALFQTSILSLNLADSFLVLYTQINPVF